MLADGITEVGKITKKPPGCCKEIFSDADNFVVDFPPGADVNTKAMLLGATFLIVRMLFR